VLLFFSTLFTALYIACSSPLCSLYTAYLRFAYADHLPNGRAFHRRRLDGTHLAQVSSATTGWWLLPGQEARALDQTGGSSFLLLVRPRDRLLGGGVLSSVSSCGPRDRCEPSPGEYGTLDRSVSGGGVVCSDLREELIEEERFGSSIVY